MPTTPAGGAEIRDRALGLLEAHDAAGGLGPDPYHKDPCVHPMAEAKYLMTVATLGGIGAGRVGLPSAEALLAAVERLERTANRSADGATAWGLGFEYKGAGPESSYVITTAMVLRALVEFIPVCPQESSARVRTLLESTYRWLAGPERLTEVGNGVRVPYFGTSTPLVVNNVVAYWAGAMALADQVLGTEHRDGRAAAEWVDSRYVRDLGWVYGDHSTRVDLLHVSYIALGLLAALPERAAELDDKVTATLLQLTDSERWFDGFDLLVRDAVLRGERPGPGNMPVRFHGEHALVGFIKPARPWSVGEALVLAADLTRRDTAAALWRPRLRPTATLAIAASADAGGPRHAMHLAHGLAATLAALSR